jgi:predicted enzyme related to lactoylglutathione lyase
MPNPNLTILYVNDAPASAAFYKGLLGRDPAFAGPSYVAFALDGGAMLGLWSGHPAAPDTSNRSELAFMVADDNAVEALHADWAGRGVTIEQKPVTAVFGRTFVALDPDGHRLRVCLADR